MRCPFEDDAVDVACLPLFSEGVLLPERMEDMTAGMVWRIEMTKGLSDDGIDGEKNRLRGGQRAAKGDQRVLFELSR